MTTSHQVSHPLIFLHLYKKIKIISKYCSGKSDSIRDLGIVIDCKMSLSFYVDNVVIRAYRNLALNISNTYVCSILECACLIWAPTYKVLKNLIESIKSKCVNHFKYRFTYDESSYEDICREYLLLINAQ